MPDAPSAPEDEAPQSTIGSVPWEHWALTAIACVTVFVGTMAVRLAREPEDDLPRMKCQPYEVAVWEEYPRVAKCMNVYDFADLFATGTTTTTTTRPPEGT